MRAYLYLFACCTATLVLGKGAKMEDVTMSTESTEATEETPKAAVFRSEAGSFNPWQLNKDYKTYLHVRDVSSYYMSVVPFCALLTNGLAMYVFFQRRKTEQTVNILLIALSVSDIFALSEFMDEAVHFWTDYRWSFQQSTGVGCKMVQYITNVARDCSSYVILAFTLDRFVAVWLPLQCGSIMSKKRVQLAIVGITFLGLALELYVPTMNEHAPGERPTRHCFVRDVKLRAKFATYLRNTIGFIVPGVAVAVLNTLIIMRIRSYKAERAALISVNGTYQQKIQRQNVSLTIMLVTASTFSFLCSTPKTGYQIWLAHNEWGGWKYLTYSYIVDMILVGNYTCNFFFYCLSGSQFRRDLMQAVCGRESFGRAKETQPSATASNGSVGGSAQSRGADDNDTRSIALTPENFCRKS